MLLFINVFSDAVVIDIGDIVANVIEMPRYTKICSYLQIVDNLYYLGMQS